jgi:hypothetical protein
MMMREFDPSSVRRLLFGLAAVASATVAHAQPSVDPATEPFLTLAPYVLQSSNLEPRLGNEDGGTRAYRPWFENGAWTGDLIEYQITADGVRLVRDDIGRYPRDGADWRGTQELWSARYAFPDFQQYDHTLEIDPNWECTEEDPNYWMNRNLFTVSAGARVPFQWNALSAAQRQVVDAATALIAGSHANPYASPILNFVRGDRSNERCKETGTYRWRFSILGAIVNSTPVFVPTGTDGLVVVGANDGMLHGFSAADGSEVFGFVPSVLLDKVGTLRISPYRPNHFVDGELRHRDIGASGTPRHIVAGGLGAGGRGLFILDVTTPAAPAVREISGTTAAHSGGTYDSRIGHIHGRPTIARLADGTPAGRWYVVAGNGYGSTAGTAELALIPVDGGTPEFVATDGSVGNGLSAPSLVDTTGNGIVDLAYAGDLLGNLWRFDLNTRTATRLFSAGAGKPITVEPDIGRHPDGLNGFMVFFGTGSLLGAGDVTDTTQQTVYGIWDRGDGLTVTDSRLITQALVSASVTSPIPQADNLCGLPEESASTATLRFVANQQSPTWSGTFPTLGWQVNLPRAGERLIGHPQIRAQRIQFVTTNPYDMIDLARIEAQGSGSWILQLDLASGGNAAHPVPLFDLNKNCTLDPGDGLPQDTWMEGVTIPQGTFPVGVALGAFHIAQPAFARVRYSELQNSVVDGVYINALQMPLRDDRLSQMVHGPLDVTTDSPAGPAHASVWPEPWKQPFDREFPQASAPTKPFLIADGIGHRTDGHSANYNLHHGVDYVDYFDLEPQRGTWRLDITSVFKDTDGLYKRISPRISERELNRVTEVGIGEQQRFIVVVTNADLSRANEIQIGCRSWPVYEYQTMMMRALRKPPGEAMAELEAAGLIFTLSGDYNPIRPPDEPLQCPGSNQIPTLRITPTGRIGSLDATMATLPGCVVNTNHYQGSSPNMHLTLKSELTVDGDFVTGKGPSDLYLNAPHVTPNREGTGRRWRNGALTVQLLAVNPDNTPAFTLQPAADLPRGNGIEGEDMGWGGTYAHAFTLVGGAVVPINPNPPPPLLSSGLLYEASQFWHWGDMTRFQQQGVGSPVTAFCYGASGNVAPALSYETEWFTPGAYARLTEGFTEAMQMEYVNLLAQLKSPDPAVVEAALIALAEMFAANPNLADYHRLRHYVQNSNQLQEHHLITIDRSNTSDPSVDGTPADVVDIERDLLPSLGPNYQLGRRSWIDLSPDP